MISLRSGNKRGLTQTTWLQSFHTFSFANYYDPEFLGFGNLLVINEDSVQPKAGFGAHTHNDMEIISYVVSGTLVHQDSTGNVQSIKPGEIQRMSAGSGIRHSEFNPSDTELLHFLQIWIRPNRNNLTPSYEQKKIANVKDRLLLIGSHDGKEEAVKIHQNVKLYAAYLTVNVSITHHLDENSVAWVQLIKGEINLNNQLLNAGDGAAITDENELIIYASKEAELLLFELTMQGDG